MIKAGIAGAAGYTGGELIRLLLRHPYVTLISAISKSSHGQMISNVHTDLLGDTDLLFSQSFDPDIDVLFLCGGHGEGKKFMEQHSLHHHTRIIDLSQDFRLDDTDARSGRTFMYGLPECNRAAITNAAGIANPGCFATALQLALLPVVNNGFAGSVYATGITGATGAGQSLSATSHFSWRSNNIQAYKSLKHQHIAEVTKHLSRQHAHGQQPQVHFVPWRGDFARGIMVSLQLEIDASLEQLREWYIQYYSTHPFTAYCHDVVHLKQVVNTNKCLISIEQHEGHTVIHAAIDNLLKGASGQAIQNMNLMFGWEETAGLNLKASYF